MDTPFVGTRVVLADNRVMLGQGCLRALFLENDLFPRKVGLRWVFVNGLKWVQKWVFRCKSGSKVGQNALFTHFKPISGFPQKPTFYPV